MGPDRARALVKSTTRAIVHHFGAQKQGSERLSHLQKFTQHNWARIQLRLARRPSEGQ